MNIFKTGPRFIRGYIETKRFTSLKKQFIKLREAGDIEGEKELIRFGQKRSTKFTARRMSRLLRTVLSCCTATIRASLIFVQRSG